MKPEREELLESALRAIYAATGEDATREHRFHPTRKWRFDVAFPSLLIAAEIDGAVWTRGRHTRGAGFVKDQEKTNAAALLGWRVFRFTWKDVERGSFALILSEALRSTKGRAA